MLTEEEIERRKPLWGALSTLWLVDTIMDENTCEYIVREMLKSRYSLTVIEQIFSEEVAPVVSFNSYKLYGGEWGCFDPDWLFSELVKNIKRQEGNFLYSAWVKSNLGKFFTTKMIENDWRKVVEFYQIKIAENKNLKS